MDLKAKIKEVLRERKLKEMSTTGGGASAGSFKPGQGPQTATPFFVKKKKHHYKLKEANPGATLGKGPSASKSGVKDNYYVKAFGYKPVNSKKLAAQSKAIDTKYLWKK